MSVELEEVLADIPVAPQKAKYDGSAPMANSVVIGENGGTRRVGVKDTRELNM